MPTKNNIELGPGELYFQTPEGLQPLGSITEAEESEWENAPEWPKENPYIKATAKEATFAAELDPNSSGAEFLRTLAAALEIARRCVEIFNNYPNKRVKHLALHAKKLRTRKKNARRIARDELRRRRQSER